MSAELNLTEKQMRRIEGAKTPEDKAAVILEAMDAPRELSDEQLDAVSGGLRIPSTHAEIDQGWDIIQKVYDKCGPDVASFVAKEMGFINHDAGSAGGSTLANRSIPELRSWMHRELDGTNNSLVKGYVMR